MLLITIGLHLFSQQDSTKQNKFYFSFYKSTSIDYYYSNTKSFSAFIWFNLSAWPDDTGDYDYARFIDLGVWNYGYACVSRYNIGEAQWYIKKQNYVTSGANIGINEWHFIGFTLSGYNFVYYFDGVNVYSGQWNEEGTGDTSPVRLGGDGKYNQQTVRGTIDQAYIYDRSLSSSEVATLYNNGRGL